MSSKNLKRCLVLLLCLCPLNVVAHSGSTAYAELDIQQEATEGAWWINLQDLQVAVGLDSNLDDQITYAEFKQAIDSILTYTQQHISLSGDNGNCAIDWRRPSLVKSDGVLFAQLPFSANCTSVNAINYSLLFDFDSSHRLIANVSNGENSRVMIFAPDSPFQAINFGDGLWSEVIVYLEQGVIHILEGYDHLLFLLALLVPLVFGKGLVSNSMSTDRNVIRPLIVSLVKVVSAFTLGHSITLIAASVFLISPPIAWVETIIAISVIIAGINIVVPLFRESCWKVACVFGLVHGFGFASVLAELSLDRTHLFMSLLSFNVGVEVGQLVVVALALPIMLLLTRTQWTAVFARYGAASTAAVVGCVWVVERLPI